MRSSLARPPPWPNIGLEPTGNSVRSFVAPAIPSGSGPALGGVQHAVARHWASPRESAEFPTSVKDVLARFVTDTPLNRVILTLAECYDDRLEYQSACWRIMALGPVLTHPALAPWVLVHSPERTAVHDAVIAAAATAPLNAQGEFLITPFCAAVERWAAEHPDT
jgi:hypothetical protein